MAASSAPSTTTPSSDELIGSQQTFEQRAPCQGVGSKQKPLVKPAPPPGPPPAARPRSAMAALAGAAVAGTVSPESKCSPSSHATKSNEDPINAKSSCSVTPTSKEASQNSVSDGIAISSAKRGTQEFVDPRLERLQFLQAVQRMRAQVSDNADIPRDALAEVIASTLAGRPQRPQSAAARLHASKQDVREKACDVTDIADPRSTEPPMPTSTTSWQ